MKVLNALVIYLTVLASSPLYADDDPWPYLRSNLFSDREINETHSFVQIYAPELAADASLVPISIRLSDDIIPELKKLYLLIDRNPDPYAMEVDFFNKYRELVGENERSINTRVRVNNFSDIRAIIETTDNKLYMDTTFVAGSGGCSSPPGGSVEDSLKNLGKIKLALSKDENIHENWRQANIRIKHPNFTGMQPSLTGNDFIPARYVNEVAVNYADEPLILISSGITVSENPAFRFDFDSETDSKINITVRDTEGEVFIK